MAQEDQIEFDKVKYDQLVKFYRAAVKAKKESFLFLGREWVTNYAKYVIEYLESHFKHK